MSFLDSLANLFVPDPVQTRAAPEFPDLEAQIAALWQRKLTHAYRLPGVNEALGVPSIFGAVSLIADTVGSLSLEAYRQGVLLDQADTPRLVQRPNPFSTPRAFFRDTAYYIATRGEAWWWVAARDSDGVAQSLYPVPPWEVVVAANDRNRLRPTITWLDRQIPNEDMRHITYLPGHDGLRGVGPLQLCEAAVSVSVEADDWAANFFSGSVPSIIGHTDQDIDELDLIELDKQWNEKAPGLPRWMTNGLELSESPFNADKAQLTESRQHQVGEVARMFNMPGALIEYQMGGSSLTYQNQENIWGDFQRRCLSPHFLEPIEQELSDLMTRSTAARFNLKQLLRADPKTRAEVYNLLVPLGILSPEEARQSEGYTPGSVDYASVPPQLPAATPERLPFQRTASEPAHCSKCHKRLADSAPPGWSTTCPRCKTPNSVPLVQMRSEESEVSSLTAALRAVAEPPVVNVPPQPTPIVNVEAQPAPVVNVRTDSFVEAINDLKAMMSAPRTRKVLRDENDQIIGSIEEIA